MSLVSFLIILCAIVAICWVVRDFIQLPQPIKMIFYVVAMIVLLYMLLSIAGVDLSGLRVGH